MNLWTRFVESRKQFAHQVVHQGTVHARRGCSAEPDSGQLACNDVKPGFPAASTQTNKILVGRAAKIKKLKVPSNPSTSPNTPMPLHHSNPRRCKREETMSSAALQVQKCVETCCPCCSLGTQLLPPKSSLVALEKGETRLLHMMSFQSWNPVVQRWKTALCDMMLHMMLGLNLEVT